MNTRRRAKRDSDIYLARLRGNSWATIGASFDLTPRQCQRIVKEHRKSLPSILQEGAADLMEELLAIYEAAISDLAMIELEAPTHTKKIKAISAKLRVLNAKSRLLNDLGVLPSPGILSQVSVGRLMNSVRAALRETKAPPEVHNAVLHAVNSWAEQEGALAPISGPNAR
jgi:hypothetical protein